MIQDYDDARYVIIRNLAAAESAGPFDMRGLTDMGPEPEPSVEILADMSKNDVADAARQPGVAAVARGMPTALIQPMDMDGDGGGDGDADPTWGLTAIGADTSSATGAGVVPAVLDTGIDRAHPAFAGKTLIERDFTTDGDGDRNGHGTHCAGTIFGDPVGGQHIGVAPGVTKAIIGKVLSDSGGGRSEWLFDGIDWAWKQGADVLSMSIGFDFPGEVARLVNRGWPVEAATSSALESYRANLRAFDSLMAMLDARSSRTGGMLVIAAAGNESDRYASAPFEVAASLPAAAEGVVSVGAVQRSAAGLIPAGFSNTFPQISAPGVAVRSAWPGGGLKTLQGTSMACPHVAGAACLWWETINSHGFNPATPRTVGAKLTAMAKADSFGPGVDPSDCGAGLATAP